MVHVPRIAAVFSVGVGETFVFCSEFSPVPSIILLYVNCAIKTDNARGGTVNYLFIIPPVLARVQSRFEHAPHTRNKRSVGRSVFYRVLCFFFFK